MQHPRVNSILVLQHIASFAAPEAAAVLPILCPVCKVDLAPAHVANQFVIVTKISSAGAFFSFVTSFSQISVQAFGQLQTRRSQSGS